MKDPGVEAPRLDPARRFLSRAFARKRPSTSDRGLVLRCAAQRDALDRYVRSRTAYPLSKGHEPIGSLCLASDIVTVRECVGVAFSFAEKVKQSVFLRWDRVAVSLYRWCHYGPLAVASFGRGIMIGQSYDGVCGESDGK